MDGEQGHKAHHKSSRGRKAKRRKEIEQRKSGKDNGPSQKLNYKAFTVANVGRRQRETQRKVDRAHRKHLGPAHKAEAEAINPPPVTVMVHGPKEVGKTTLIKCLVKHWTRKSLVTERKFEGFGPVNVVSGRNRRLTLFECPSNDLSSMVDLSKVSDLVLLLINAEEGLTLPTFEVLNCLQTHGMPKVIAVITHLDKIKDMNKVKKVKKAIKHRLWTETYDGAKVFYLSQLKNEKYLKNEVNNLARFVSLAKFRPLSWKNSHSYLLIDRVEDLTAEQKKEENTKCDREVVLYGYLRGISLRKGSNIHLCGVGDFSLNKVSAVQDPLPLGERHSETEVRKRLKQKDTVVYAPMANIGAVVYDKDAVYINLPDSHFTSPDKLLEGEVSSSKASLGVQMVRELQEADVEEKPAEFQLFSGSKEEEGDDSDSESISAESGSGSDSETSLEEEMKSRIMKAAAATYEERVNRNLDIMEIVYGSDELEEEAALSEDDDDENFFKLAQGGDVKKDIKGRASLSKQVDALLTSLSLRSLASMSRWNDLEAREAIRNRFVTGNWEEEQSSAEDEDAESSTANSKAEDFQGIEDLEEESPEESRKRFAEEKLLKKKQFDEEYDEEKMNVQKEEGLPSDEVDLDDDHMLEEMDKATKQKSLNKTAFENLTTEDRADIEGYRPGSYLRILLKGVSFEFIEHLTPKRPILVGSLDNNSTKGGNLYVKARIKKHRWFSKKVLKTNDPLVFSFGWRRFQAAPLYFMEDQNERQRMLKYTPEHMHCNALFISKQTPLNTPFLCFQDIRENQKEFRIAATGISLQVTPTSQVKKKLKLVGEPYKIQKNTCFIKKMFNSSLEVAKFEGARIQTVSGIRGVIKKAVTTNKDKGNFRATFEDKVQMSDLVFCKTWIKVEPLPLCTPIRNMLHSIADLSSREINSSLMRTVAQIRYVDQSTVPVNPDSLYKDIKREKKAFSKVVLPKSLQRNLPFKAREKHVVKRQRPQDLVLLTDREQKVQDLLGKLSKIKSAKLEKVQLANKRRLANKTAKERQLMKKFALKSKEERKRKFRAQGLRNKQKMQRL